jgi:hypothetical protein
MTMFKTVTISKSALINLGDYQNEKVEVSLSYEVEPGETVEQATAKVADEARKLLIREMEPVLEQLPDYRARGWRDILGVPAPVDDEEDDALRRSGYIDEDSDDL